MNCYRFNEIISDYLENNLSVTERKDADNHLIVCETCRVLLQDMQEMLVTAKNLNSLTVHDDFDNRLFDRIEKINNKNENKKAPLFIRYAKPLSAVAALFFVISAAYISYDAYYPNLNPLQPTNHAKTTLSEPMPDPVLQQKVKNLASQPLKADSSQLDNSSSFDDNIRLVNDKK